MLREGLSASELEQKEKKLVPTEGVEPTLP